jgi:hypothetical protein
MHRIWFMKDSVANRPPVLGGNVEMFRRLVLVCALGLAVGLVGCGDDDGDGKGGNGGGGGNGGSGSCEGYDAALVGSCAQEDDVCIEYRGAIPSSEVPGLQEDCEFNAGAVWSTTEGCPAAARASGACVLNVGTAVTVMYFGNLNLTPAQAETACEMATGGWCYVAP